MRRGIKRKGASVQHRTHDWLALFEHGSDRHPGQTLVRLARLAESMHRLAADRADADAEAGSDRARAPATCGDRDVPGTRHPERPACFPVPREVDP